MLAGAADAHAASSDAEAVPLWELVKLIDDDGFNETRHRKRRHLT
jgi:hypothetical protein